MLILVNFNLVFVMQFSDTWLESINCCYWVECDVRSWCEIVVWCCGVRLWCEVVVWCCGVRLWCDVVVWGCGVRLWCEVVVWCGVRLWCDVVVWGCGVRMLCEDLGGEYSVANARKKFFFGLGWWSEVYWSFFIWNK